MRESIIIAKWSVDIRDFIQINGRLWSIVRCSIYIYSAYGLWLHFEQFPAVIVSNGARMTKRGRFADAASAYMP